MTKVSEESARLGATVTFGPATVRDLPSLVRSLGAGRVLLVCGRRSFEASGAAEILPELQGAAEVTRWSDFSPNTDADDLARGLEELATAEPDLVLGVGGGSAMDMAKLLCAYAGTDASCLHEAIRRGERVESRGPRLFLVPTTSGSGSEATHFAVVYIGQEKFSIAGPAMLPDRVVLDPALTLSGSSYQRATSGIDAVCQAIESLWATGATAESCDDARRALDLLLDHLEPFVEAPTLSAAQGMSLGSHLAGRAINVTKTTAAHALSYGITKRHGVSHGHAVAVTLGAFIEAHADVDAAALQPAVDPRRHQRAMQEILSRLGATDGHEANERFRALLERIGLEPRLAVLGAASETECRELVAAVNLERLGNNPVIFGQEGLSDLLLSTR